MTILLWTQYLICSIVSNKSFRPICEYVRFFENENSQCKCKNNVKNISFFTVVFLEPIQYDYTIIRNIFHFPSTQITHFVFKTAIFTERWEVCIPVLYAWAISNQWIMKDEPDAVWPLCIPFSLISWRATSCWNFSRLSVSSLWWKRIRNGMPSSVSSFTHKNTHSNHSPAEWYKQWKVPVMLYKKKKTDWLYWFEAWN